MTSGAATIHLFYFSNYCEKVVWAIEYKSLEIPQRYYLPFLHMRPLKKLSGQTSVPVLSCAEDVIAGSAKIIDTLETRFGGASLYPTDAQCRAAALDWQNRLDELGPTIRGALFYDLIEDPGFMFRVLTTDRGGLGMQLYRVFFRAMFPMLRKMLRENAPDAERLRTGTAALLDEVSCAVNANGYLVGDRFSIADLTAAALLYPLFFPNGTPSAGVIDTGKAGRRWLSRWDDHPAKDYVADIYQRHRPRPSDSGAPSGTV